MAGIGLPVEPRRDPWRRTSGIHKVRSRRGLAYVAELWHARDAIAARLDRAPGRILPDGGISDLAALAVDGRGPDRTTLRRIPGFARRQARQFEADWVAAVDRAAARSRGGPAGPAPAHRRSAAGPALGGQGSDRRRAARADAGGAGRDLDRGQRPRREPADPGLRPPASPGDRRTRSVRSRWTPRLPALGARPWQRELTVPDLTAALIGSSAG